MGLESPRGWQHNKQLTVYHTLELSGTSDSLGDHPLSSQDWNRRGLHYPISALSTCPEPYHLQLKTYRCKILWKALKAWDSREQLWVQIDNADLDKPITQHKAMSHVFRTHWRFKCMGEKTQCHYNKLHNLGWEMWIVYYKMRNYCTCLVLHWSYRKAPKPFLIPFRSKYSNIIAEFSKHKNILA